MYICFDKLVSKVFKGEQDKRKIVDFLDKVATDKIEPFIDKSYQALASYVNAYEQKMQMAREVIADKEDSITAIFLSLMPMSIPVLPSGRFAFLIIRSIFISYYINLSFFIF